MTKTRALPLLAVLAAAAALAGCVSLLPKSKPAQLYRFAYRGAGAASPADCSAAGKVGVVVSPPELTRASGGDQLLTVTGDEAAYIAASRWVAPAVSLFQDAVDDAFQGSCQVRLVHRADTGAGTLRLRLDVGRFEIDYPSPGAAPRVNVQVTATILKRDGDFGDETTVRAAAPAAADRVGAIVEAYSAATTAALSDLRAWVDTRAPAIDAQATASQAVVPGAAGVAFPRVVTRSSTTTSTATSASH